MNCGWKDKGEVFESYTRKFCIFNLGKWPLCVYLMNWRKTFTGKELILISNRKQHLCHLSTSSKFCQ